MTHFIDDNFGSTEAEVAVDIVGSKIVEAEDGMQNVLGMVLHESPRDQIFAYQPVAHCNDKRQHQQVASATATATAQASAVDMALHSNSFVGFGGNDLGNH